MNNKQQSKHESICPADASMPTTQEVLVSNRTGSFANAELRQKQSNTQGFADAPLRQKQSHNRNIGERVYGGKFCKRCGFPIMSLRDYLDGGIPINHQRCIYEDYGA
jgi:hypothetical protein